MKNCIYHGLSAVRSGYGRFANYISGLCKCRVTTNDTTCDFLNNKISAGSNITTAVLNPGANEQLQINCTIPTAKIYTNLCYGYSWIITTSKFLNPVSGGISDWGSSNGHGYYIPRNCKIVELNVCVYNYITSASNQYTRFQLKRIAATGYSSPVTSASGANLLNYDLIYPNTSNNNRYHFGGGQSALSLSLVAGDMLFIPICAQTANTVIGACAWVKIEE